MAEAPLRPVKRVALVLPDLTIGAAPNWKPAEGREGAMSTTQLERWDVPICHAPRASPGRPLSPSLLMEVLSWAKQGVASPAAAARSTSGRRATRLCACWRIDIIPLSPSALRSHVPARIVIASVNDRPMPAREQAPNTWYGKSGLATME